MIWPQEKYVGRGLVRGFDGAEWLFFFFKLKNKDKITVEFSELGAAFHGQNRLDRSGQLMGWCPGGWEAILELCQGGGSTWGKVNNGNSSSLCL